MQDHPSRAPAARPAGRLRQVKQQPPESLFGSSLREHLEPLLGIAQTRAEGDHEGKERAAIALEIGEEFSVGDLDDIGVDERRRCCLPEATSLCLLRDSRINRIFEGTNEINRLLVPATVLRRAVKGQIPLLDHAMSIWQRLAAGEVPQPAPGEAGVEGQIAEFCKWIALYVLAVAAETYYTTLSEEQEVLGEVADTISRVYALDSVVQRVRQILAGGDARRPEVARDMLTAYAPRAYGFVVHTGRHVLMDICEAASLAGHLEAINTLRMDWPTKVIAAKRRLAASALGADGYPLV